MNIVNGVRMQYFKAEEFHRQAAAGGTIIDWSKSMDRRLLGLLDGLRSVWGKPIHISNGAGAVGRYVGTSRHSLEQWGTVMAVDIIPTGVSSRQDAEKFYYQAKQLGFGGIGLYPQFNQGVGFHLDTRECKPYKPQCWGLVNGKYISLHETFRFMDLNPRA